MKYIYNYANTIEEMCEWLNWVVETYDNYDTPYLTGGGLKCIVLVWEKE